MAFEQIVVARSVFLATTFVLFGAALFPHYSGVGAQQPILPRPGRAILAPVALMAALVWFAAIVQAAAQEGEGVLETAYAILFETSFGPVWLIRLGALALLVVASFGGRDLPVLALSGAVVACEGWTGHAAAWRALASLNQALHALAGAAWIGALVALMLLLRRASRQPEHVEGACRALSSFSGAGVALVVVIAATGAVNTWMVLKGLPDPSRLYDRVLLAKVGLFLAMVAVAATNRFVLVPAMQTSGKLRAPTLAVAAEQVLGVLVLVEVGALGLLSPASGR
jgi:putative copper resistance protein D